MLTIAAPQTRFAWSFVMSIRAIKLLAEALNTATGTMFRSTGVIVVIENVLAGYIV